MSVAEGARGKARRGYRQSVGDRGLLTRDGERVEGPYQNGAKFERTLVPVAMYTVSADRGVERSGERG